MYKHLTFCMMSTSSGLRSLSIEEMLSMLFFRTIPAANGFTMTPGEAWANNKKEKHIWVFVVSLLCALPQFQLNIYLHACDVSGVKAITHQHDQGISCGTQDPDCLRVSHTKETVIAHLQDSHTHLQAAISCCSTTGAHLKSTDKYGTFFHTNLASMSYAQKSLNTNWTLFLPWRWRCPHLLDQRGCLHALWLLLGCWCPASLQAACEWQFPIHIENRGLVSTLSNVKHLQCIGECTTPAPPSLCACMYVPACQVVKGLCALACGSPCCWRAGLWQPPDGWRVADQ